MNLIQPVQLLIYPRELKCALFLFLIGQFFLKKCLSLPFIWKCVLFNQAQKSLTLKKHPTLQNFCNQCKLCSRSRNFLKLLYRYYCNNVYSYAKVYLGPEIYTFPGQGLLGASDHRRSTLVAVLKAYRPN